MEAFVAGARLFAAVPQHSLGQREHIPPRPPIFGGSTHPARLLPQCAIGRTLPNFLVHSHEDARALRVSKVGGWWDRGPCLSLVWDVCERGKHLPSALATLPSARLDQPRQVRPPQHPAPPSLGPPNPHSLSDADDAVQLPGDGHRLQL